MKLIFNTATLLLGALLGSPLVMASPKNTKCIHQIQRETINIGWVGYKTTEKLPVKGRFTNPTLMTSPQNNLKSLIKGTSIELVPNFLDTKDKGRDKTLGTEFFSKFAGDLKILGSAKNVSLKGKTGTFDLHLKMNGAKGKIPMTLKVDNSLSGGTIEATGVLHFDDFRLEKPLASLHKACKVLHKGKDGVSKTWPEAKIILSAKFKTECLK